MFYNIIFQQSAKITEQNLHMAKNCCNFATANGKRTPAAKSGGGAPEAKKDNDILPQDKQRLQGVKAAKTGNERQGNNSFRHIPTPSETCHGSTNKAKKI